MIPINLSPSEIGIAWYLGRKRSALMDNRIHRYSVYANGSQHPNSMIDNVLGIAGEMAFCKWAGIYPDLSADYTDGHDAVISGVVYNIKAVSAGKHLNLIVPRHQREYPADWYVLIDIDLDNRQAWIVGMMDRVKVFSELNLKRDIPVPAYFIRRDELQAPSIYCVRL